VRSKGSVGRSAGRRGIVVVGAVLGVALAGCGGSGSGNDNQPPFPGTLAFTVLPGGQGTPTRYYLGSGAKITPTGAAALTRSDLRIYGASRFASYDPGTQNVNAAALTVIGRYTVDVTSSGSGVNFTISDVMQADRVVTQVSAGSSGMTQGEALAAIRGVLGDGPTGQGIAEAIALVSVNQ
jgi:hypothetical protein